MNAHELSMQMLQTVRDLRAAQQDLEQCSREYARAEKAYRLHKAKSYLSAHGGTVAEREAHAETNVIDNATLADARFARDLAEGLKVSSLEAVRSHRGVLSALQSLAAVERAEAELARFEPREVAGP